MSENIASNALLAWYQAQGSELAKEFELVGKMPTIDKDDREVRDLIDGQAPFSSSLTVGARPKSSHASTGAEFHDLLLHNWASLRRLAPNGEALESSGQFEATPKRPDLSPKEQGLLRFAAFWERIWADLKCKTCQLLRANQPLARSTATELAKGAILGAVAWIGFGNAPAPLVSLAAAYLTYLAAKWGRDVFCEGCSEQSGSAPQNTTNSNVPAAPSEADARERNN